jgi:hypothetical protein
MTTEPMAAPGAMEPVRYEVEHAESLSRLLIFVKWILVIPHLIVIAVLGFVAYVFTIIAFFTILFTQKYPEGLHKFVVGMFRWQANANAYSMLLRDEYPPFSWEPGQYPVTMEIEYPETLNRWAPLYKWLLAIPNMIVFIIVALVAYILIIVGWFAILFTGQLPRGIHDFVVGTMRWGTRLNAYVYLLRDEYPAFSLK